MIEPIMPQEVPAKGAGLDGTAGKEATDDDGFSFGDFLDIINPLHHLPVIGHIYRAVSGDEIESSGRLLGGALFGGPIGFGLAMVDVGVKESTGQDLGEHVVAMLDDSETPTPEPTVRIAEAEKKPSIAPHPPRNVAQSKTDAPQPAVALSANSAHSAVDPQIPTDPPITPSADLGQTSVDARLAAQLMAMAAQSNQIFAQQSAETPLNRLRQDLLRQRPPTKAPEPPVSVSGAIPQADPGGWFSKVMLRALEKYEQTSQMTP